MTPLSFMLVALVECALGSQPRADACATIADAAGIRGVGAFSNMRYTEEHAYGYTVMLWRAGDCLVGLFESSEGLAGDTPIGELQNVRYDRRTGTLSFSAKLTMGLEMRAGIDEPEPSRDLFTFDGRLGSNALAGIVTHASGHDPASRRARVAVTLRASAAQAESMRGPTTYGEWRDAWKPVLLHRGPKW